MKVKTEIVLKPCPFCGRPAQIKCSDSGCYWVECSAAYDDLNVKDEEELCGAAFSLPEVYGYTSEESVAKAWNTRK